MTIVVAGAGPVDAVNPLGELPELLRRSAHGDDVAFARLYTLTASRLLAMALRVTSSRSHAEDAVQEAFLVIWRTCGQFDTSRGSAIGWMLTIAHRRAVDRVRSSAATSRRDEAWARHLVESSGADETAEAAHASLDALQVRTALRSLSSQQSTAIVLAYFGGLTYTQVAFSLGIPLGTAKSRIRDGLHALRKAVDPALVF